MRKTGRSDHPAPDSHTAPPAVNHALMVYAAAASASAGQPAAAVPPVPADSAPAETAAAPDTTDPMFEPATQARFRSVYTVLAIVIRPLQRTTPQLMRMVRVVRLPWLLIPLAVAAGLFALSFPFRRLLPGLFATRRKAMSTLTLTGLMAAALFLSLPLANSSRRADTRESDFQTLPELAGEDVVITHDHETELPDSSEHQFATPLLVRPPGRQRAPRLNQPLAPAPLIVPGAWDQAEMPSPAPVRTVQATLQQVPQAGREAGGERVVWLTGVIETESYNAARRSRRGPQLR